MPEMCIKNRVELRKKNIEDVIRDFRKEHGDFYDYSKVNYVNNATKICIICPIHGEFWQTPHHHLAGFGCKKCSDNFLDTKLFIEKSLKIHGEKYDYSKVDYKNNRTKVCIICPEHGEFWQTPNSHLNGRGCLMCKESHLEREVASVLDKNGIEYIRQYRNKEIFGHQSIDYYIPNGKIGIECQGEQHYVSNYFKSKGIEFAGKHLEYIQNLDMRKKKICKENGIALIYFLNRKYNLYMKEDDVFANDENGLLDRIKENLETTD